MKCKKNKKMYDSSENRNLQLAFIAYVQFATSLKRVRRYVTRWHGSARVLRTKTQVNGKVGNSTPALARAKLLNRQSPKFARVIMPVSHCPYGFYGQVTVETVG